MIASSELLKKIKTEANLLGLDIAVVQPDLKEASLDLKTWLKEGYHGTMSYMERSVELRSHPEKLHPGTKTIIMVRLNYYTKAFENAFSILDDSKKAYISRYALGRDYHKVLKAKLKKLQQKMELAGARVFVDSAPVLEKPIAEQAGLGFIGKHTNLIDKKKGSYFFLGELYTELDIQIKPKKATNHCGTCTKCIDICPTGAIIDAKKIDARKCISYLTIEYKGVIDPIYHKAIGNRIFGCDDCQLICPFNRFAQISHEIDFEVRNHLDEIDLLTLWGWDEATFLAQTEGMALRRVGYQNFMRNIAIALGNVEGSEQEKEVIITALKNKYDEVNEVVQSQINWAIQTIINPVKQRLSTEENQ